ncbi:hypothetical protein HPB48_014731 [Haemaphysalis longicornis]|uniref:Reverse transcriptase zinc-binding domain-containing protein n=1 Tax=Haemaphysalis longicornis TaxID=44386 RepID=A0A9J6G673_HAELO|nr:hypothetical protein HPB48_014731 [Haemaphysalis longicornis]
MRTDSSASQTRVLPAEPWCMSSTPVVPPATDKCLTAHARRLRVQQVEAAEWYEAAKRKSALTMYIQEKREIRREGLYDNSWGSGLLAEARGGLLRTRVWRARFTGELQTSCALCGECDETLEHVIVGCPNITPPARTMSLPTALGFRIGGDVEQMVVSLSYGTAFFSINIAVAMLLFCVLVTDHVNDPRNPLAASQDNQKGMALTTHLLKTRFIFLLIFLGLFNAEVRGMVGFKFERDILVSFPPSTEAPATSARVAVSCLFPFQIADPDLSLIAEVRQKKSHTWNATIMHQKPVSGEELTNLPPLRLKTVLEKTRAAQCQLSPPPHALYDRGEALR